MSEQRRRVTRVLGTGVLAGLLAGLAAGAIDALWSWGPAAQFVPGFFGRARFILFSASIHAAAGALAGLAIAGVLLVLSRASRLGDLARFGWAEHLSWRAKDPRDAVAGLALVIATLPCVGAALMIAFKITAKFVAGRKAPDLVVIVAMVAGLAAVAIAIPIAFVIARAIENGLRHAVPKVPVLASPCAPFVAGGVLISAGAIAWAVRAWETARVLPLRGPIVIAVGVVLAIPLWRPARRIDDIVNVFRPAIRRTTWGLLPVVLLGLVLATGGSGSVMKAAQRYTGIAGTIARELRRVFDWDRDGFARFLGGGDCDDGDASINPIAAEVPEDGLDQNCIGGDPNLKPPPHDVAFVAVPPAVPNDFNVLVITIDTIRADHMGMYGYKRPTTPRLDQLAADGTVFENGWAHAPSTRYSIPAILTGRLPLDVDYDTSIDGWPGLLPAATTFAEALQPFGFTGGALTNYWYFDRIRNMNQGFAEYDNENAIRHQSVGGAGPEQTKGSSSVQQTDKAIKFVERQAGKRWLLWVHYYDPHYAYELHADTGTFGMDRQAMYDGEIKFTDHHIGRLLDDLRAKGLYDKTVVVITGDHGEGFGEHGVDLHGYHLYAAQTKVPLIVRVPGIAPRRAATPAGHIDILPTLVNLAGGTATPEMMGRSLVGPIAGQDADRVVFQQLSFENNNEMRGAASRTCHVIYNVSPDPGWETYRIDRDPTESADLGDDDACDPTWQAFGKWFDASQIPAGAADALLSQRPTVAVPLDAELGSGVRLLGLDTPATVKRGEAITLTWTFEARAKIDAGWKMFVHVEGHNRAVAMNGDHRPVRPFEWWKPGDFVRYSTTLVVPRNIANGSFTVWAGMFKGKARAKVRAPNARVENNAVAAATLQVVQ